MIENIGNNIDTKFYIENKLNTSDILVQVQRTVDGEVVIPDITIYEKVIIVEFSFIPSNEEFRVLTIKADEI